VQVCKMQEHFGIRRKPVKGFNNRSRKEQKITEYIFALGNIVFSYQPSLQLLLQSRQPSFRDLRPFQDEQT